MQSNESRGNEICVCICMHVYVCWNLVPISRQHVIVMYTSMYMYVYVCICMHVYIKWNLVPFSRQKRYYCVQMSTYDRILMGQHSRKTVHLYVYVCMEEITFNRVRLAATSYSDKKVYKYVLHMHVLQCLLQYIFSFSPILCEISSKNAQRIIICIQHIQTNKKTVQ